MQADNTGDLARYICGQNGQYNYLTGLQTSFLMKPYYGPKDADGIVWELFLNGECAQSYSELRPGHHTEHLPGSLSTAAAHNAAANAASNAVLAALMYTEDSTEIVFMAADGGPLNTSSEVSYWWPQFNIDAGLAKYYQAMVFKHYDGKMECDGGFGRDMMLVESIGLVIGPEVC